MFMAKHQKFLNDVILVRVRVSGLTQSEARLCSQNWLKKSEFQQHLAIRLILLYLVLGKRTRI